jgi:hypothetical protein
MVWGCLYCFSWSLFANSWYRHFFNLIKRNMQAIRDWGKACLIAQGVKKVTDHALREDPAVDYGKRVVALGDIETINYIGVL